MDGPKHSELHGVVPGSRIRVGKERARIGPGGEERDEPEVILIRDGDTIQAIEVVCTCGKRTRLNCIF